MKVSALTLLMAVGIALSAVSADARKVTREVPMPTSASGSNISLDHDPATRPLRAATVNDTTVLGAWTFDLGGACTTENWVSVDRTAQEGEHFHVDDFIGLTGPTAGRLFALEGSKSMWCGLRASTTDPVVCGYAALPGYGNNWHQAFCTKTCLSVIGDVSVDYLVSYDSEPGYDGTRVEWDLCDDNWQLLAPDEAIYESSFGPVHFQGIGTDVTQSMVLPDSLHSGQMRIRFRFTSDGAWSDEDGFFQTDGAFILDSLIVSDAAGAVLALEDFEGEAVGATESNDWTMCNPPGFGDYSGLFLGSSVVQEDPCKSNFSCMWGFFNGSTDNYACGGWPQQAAMPMGKGTGQYLSNEIHSPWVPYSGAGNDVTLEFDVYRDLPLDNLQFFTFGIRSLVGGCPGPFRDRNFVYFGGQKDWFRFVFEIGDLIDSGATHLQASVGAVDMCGVWCGSHQGTGNCHSHAPLIDNVTLYRVDRSGPRWSVRDLEMFQDNFPGDGTITGTVRADMANDILPSSSPNILPGDSVVITVNDPGNGLAADPYTGFGSAVYMYVAVWPQGQAGKSGTNLTDDAFRYPVVDSLMHNGVQWTCVRTDTSFFTAPRTSPGWNRFCVDLRDDLFTPGDTVCFFFSATSDISGETNYYSLETGAVATFAEAAANPMEFTCLPAGGDILYVDAYDGRGAQPFFDTAFDMLGVSNRVDRYDVRAPSSSGANNISSRVTDVDQQITAIYRTIIWNTGDNMSDLLGDSYSKHDEAALLASFLDNLTVPGGVYFSGDHLADTFYNETGVPGLTGLRLFMQGSTASTDHNAFGLGVAPFGVGETGSCFDHGGALDTLVAYGGCPTLSAFDVLVPAGSSTLEMSYHGNAGTGGAVIAQQTVNSMAAQVGVVMSGFSFHQIRDASIAGVPARAEHLGDILNWLGDTVGLPTPVLPTGGRNTLAQNYPNPFNPTTTIAFTLRQRSHVQLRVYNVAGQLVHTLLDDVRAPGVAHSISWDGRNASGQNVASGVYFYRLVTRDFTQTRKMVLLK